MKKLKIPLLLLGIALLAWGVMDLGTFIQQSQQVILLQASLVEACESGDAVLMRSHRETLNRYLGDVSERSTPFVPLGAMIAGLLLMTIPRKK